MPQVGAGRAAGRPGRAAQDKTPTEQLAQETSLPYTPQDIENKSPEHPPEARTSEILCNPNAGTKSAVDERLVTRFTVEREALFVPGCRPVDRCFFCWGICQPFSCRACSGKTEQFCPFQTKYVMGRSGGGDTWQD